MTALIILSLLGILVLMMGLFHLKNNVLILIIPVLIGALFLNAQEWGNDAFYFSKMVHFDKFALGFSSLLILVVTLIFGLCSQHYKSTDKSVEDIYALIIFSLVGAICMVSYHNLIMLILGIEILSIPLYILAGSNRDNYASNEASLKYFLMGAFASAFILFGMALVFGATNSFQLDEIRAAVSNPKMPGLLHTGIFLMIGGILFKVAAAPFHFWAPDVYQGSPSVITSFMATVVKTAAFAALFRLLFIAFQDISGIWLNLLMIVTALSLFIGNLSALQQSDFKRLMAFSGISHAGFMMLSVLVLKMSSADALLFYATSYCLASLCAFSVFLVIQQKTGEYSIEILRGIAKKNPFLGFAIICAFLSLAGIPPLAGFFGKYFLFIEAIKHGYLVLVIIAIVNTVIGAFYYLKVINVAFTGDSFYEKPIKNSVIYETVIVFTAIGSLILGIFPDILKGILF
jgi:NADH-quinone oxidoreductase subunit N